MNLYLDTSALVKLYVFEKGTRDVQSDVKRARMVATSSAAYPEARAALARREREGGISADDLRRIVQDLDGDWGSFVVVELTSRVALLVGNLQNAMHSGVSTRFTWPALWNSASLRV